MKYTIEEIEYYTGEIIYRLTIPETGEIREALTLEAILRSLVRDHGFYLRKVG